MNGNMDASLFYDLYYAGPEVSFESFRDYMGEIHFQDIWMIPNKRNISTMLYSMTILNLGLLWRGCNDCNCSEYPGFSDTSGFHEME